MRASMRMVALKIPMQFLPPAPGAKHAEFYNYKEHDYEIKKSPIYPDKDTHISSDHCHPGSHHNPDGKGSWFALKATCGRSHPA